MSKLSGKMPLVCHLGEDFGTWVDALVSFPGRDLKSAPIPALKGRWAGLGS